MNTQGLESIDSVMRAATLRKLEADIALAKAQEAELLERKSWRGEWLHNLAATGLTALSLIFAVWQESRAASLDEQKGRVETVARALSDQVGRLSGDVRTQHARYAALRGQAVQISSAQKSEELVVTVTGVIDHRENGSSWMELVAPPALELTEAPGVWISELRTGARVRDLSRSFELGRYVLDTPPALSRPLAGRLSISGQLVVNGARELSDRTIGVASFTMSGSVAELSLDVLAPGGTPGLTVTCRIELRASP